MKKIIELWDSYKTVVDDAKNCYLQAQERGSTDPIDFAAPFVYQQLQRHPDIAGGSRGVLFIGAYIANKYPHLHDDIIGKTEGESISTIEELVKEVFYEPERITESNE